ncbi:hypothetical protein [Paenibacillus sp. 1P03SA]|uniref:hypothetical protein n=1 Tax=Paenibacillus sp. 1P03SA TaxID=3132294 RepID=UPI0039A325F3
MLSKATLKSCLIPYIDAGWTGYMPSVCDRTQLHIPEKIAPWLWGCPDKFLHRLDKAGTRVIVVGGDGSDFSSGFDTPQTSNACLTLIPAESGQTLLTGSLPYTENRLKPRCEQLRRIGKKNRPSLQRPVL